MIPQDKSSMLCLKLLTESQKVGQRFRRTHIGIVDPAYLMYAGRIKKKSGKRVIIYSHPMPGI